MEFYARLSRITDSVLVVTHSSQLSLTMQHAHQACDQCNCSATVEVVDSRTTSIGLGMLVQDAARAAAQGATLKEIDQRLRTNLSRVYMLFCIPELTRLARSGFMDRAQAQVGEMLGILPIFTFDEGRLAPLEKVRTPRHLWEVLQEFLEEFENPDHISLVRSLVPSSLHIGPLHHFINDTFPETRYTEHTLSPQLAALFGPQSIGLAVWDSEE